MKRVLLFISLLLVSLNLLSQETETKFWDNVRFGGGLGLGFGTSTTIAISPSAIYDFENGVSLGLGLNYLHNSRSGNSANVYGGSLISFYNIPSTNIQLSSEFEQLFVNRKINNVTDNYNYPALYLGLAYRQGWASIGIRYDVLYKNSRSIYASAISPVIRVFF
ncbi:hypothetical protein WH52_10170 [Tenacibaculum holothuriorum]|uniref:Alpha-ketoglutarate decarboxylase n=1 Tax=Tenacibaculum holothuriorum TaxID=1635173 RepID=A0A1Y2PCN7_9FLAO|nr:hypothetical protein [Tenacibaculum holothuriorum]OSY87781.1 hypothetical protein WH52_10170 [Tenacibaculum holothuriorum]